MKNKTNEGHIATVIIAFILFILIAIAMSLGGDNEADQYNEMIHNLQLNEKNVCSDGYYIIVKE